MRVWCLFVAPLLVFAGIAAAPTAAAQCSSADGMTLCPMDDEDGNLNMPTLPSRTGIDSSAGSAGRPGYSYGPGSTYNRYYDHGYRWFNP